MASADWTVLIVDDCADDRAEIRRLLLSGSERRMRLVEATTGAQGVAACADADVVVLDNRLPDADALGVLRALGKGRVGAPLPVPVLVLTGAADAGSMRALLEAGAMDYLGKGWMDDGALVHALEGTVTRHALQTELARSRIELERARRAADESRRRAESSDRHKSEFLARMSHELRTPIAAILGYAELLDDQVSGPEGRDHLGIVRRSGHTLLDLVDEILDLSRIEAGAVELRHAVFAPHVLLREVIDLLRLTAADKGIALDLEFASMLPETAGTDLGRLRQVLVNLAGNAVKFTAEGSVRLVAGCVPGDGDDGSMELAVDVIDTGIGIDPSIRAELFEPFNQANRTIVHRYGGSGLGLAISHRLARLLGGDLEFDSVPGEGSRFTLRVPLHEPGPMRWPPPDVGSVAQGGDADASAGASAAASIGAAVATTPSRAMPLARVRALVVDDQEELRELTASRLRAAGAQVDAVGDGLAAIGAVGGGARRFDLILMDVQMPGIDGREAVRRLRAAGCAIPVLALTANAMEGDRERCLAAGCDDYLAKPVPRGRLIERAAALACRPSPLRVLIVDDDRLTCLMMVRRLTRLGHEVRHALGCRAALDEAADFAPDAVVTDLQLPDGDGHELARALRPRLGAGARIIALSGHRPRAEDADDLFDARFVKPIAMDALANALAA